jgi:integrase
MSVERYATKTGDQWMVRYRDLLHQPKKVRGFATKKDAQKWERDTLTAMAGGTYTDPNVGRRTVGEIAPRFFAIHPAKPATIARYESAWRVRVERQWGSVPVRNVRVSDVKEWVRAMELDGRSAATIGSALDVLSGVMALAVEDRLIPANPVPEVTRPTRQRKRRNYLDHGQVARLADECGASFAPYGLVVRVLAYTGLRFGELSALRAGDFDAARRRLRVRDGATEVKGRRFVGTTKTGGERSVPVPDFLVPALVEQTKGRLPDAWLFAGPMGAPLSVQRFRARAWRRALLHLRRADPSFPYVTPHDLRHSAASLAVSAGANVKVLQRMLGHDRATTTLDTYADLLGTDLDDVAARMSAAATAAASAPKPPARMPRNRVVGAPDVPK